MDLARMKKILLCVFAGLCLVWAGVAAFTPLAPPRGLESKWQQAADEALKIETGSSLWINWKDTDKLTINRGTLSLLRERAEWPATLWRRAQLQFKSSAFFALTAGISLLLLSRKARNEKTAS